jgi:hypothetical protein
MRLGDVLKKERARCGLGPSETAGRIRLDRGDYDSIERGESAAENWGPAVAKLAIALHVPMARLLSPTGRAADVGSLRVGALLERHRLERGRAPEEFAQHLGIDVDEYRAAEAGDSPLEQIAPWLLAFAELVDQPVFNFFYPCGLPLERVDDYP